MFSLKEFIKSGLLKAIGKMADYQIILNAAGWLEKGVLEESDLAEIQTAINGQYSEIKPLFNENVHEEVSEVVTEDVTENANEEDNSENQVTI